MGHLIETYGLALLFLIVALEAAGVPVPGETALIAASALASQGYFNIVWVIAVAAAAAIVGDNVGYWIGRMGGRSLLSHSPFIARYTERVLPWGERFFARHGGKTVFFARFITGLRVAGAWIAGITGMRWWRFLFWNAAGGIVLGDGIRTPRLLPRARRRRHAPRLRLHRRRDHHRRRWGPHRHALVASPSLGTRRDVRRVASCRLGSCARSHPFGRRASTGDFYVQSSPALSA